ncbi:NADP-dependent isocitrate dehydrogenase [bacterium]|nr:NADP-dependent isocitrate dehydrogenase [bacterium]
MLNEVLVVCLEGDGIGPEITAAMKQVVDAATINQGLKIKWEDHRIGVSALEQGQDMLPPHVIERIQEVGVAIKGPTETPVGSGHRSVNVALRQALGLYANIRPVRWFSGVESPVKHPERVDLTIFRENTEDVYAGIEYAAGSDEARALHEFLHLPASISEESALGIKPISEKATRKLMRKAVAFALDSSLRRITVVHKGNIMKFTEGAFRSWAVDEAKRILRERFLDRGECVSEFSGCVPDGRVLVQERIADAMFQELILRPEEHEILVAPNLNGDYLSDAAAALVGGLGLAPGINIGEKVAVFEAVHGTAPDIAGQNVANPSALILSATLLLKHLGYADIAARIEHALGQLIKENTVTGDLFSLKRTGERLSCSDFGNRLSALLQSG